MQKWEYLRIKLWREKPRFANEWTDFKATVGNRDLTIEQFDSYMQTLGDQGWELVFNTPIAFYDGGMTTSMHIVFKRPKE